MAETPNLMAAVLGMVTVVDTGEDTDTTNQNGDRAEDREKNLSVREQPIKHTKPTK